jgi:PhnB protein
VLVHVNPYLNFDGRCEEAFAFYADCFSGNVEGIFRFRGAPIAETVPPEWQEKVMHATLTFGGQSLMGSDVPPGQYEAPRGFALSLHLADVGEAERIFARLADGGTVTMPLQQTFWAARFGLLVDRFGIPWMVNCGEPE